MSYKLLIFSFVTTYLFMLKPIAVSVDLLYFPDWFYHFFVGKPIDFLFRSFVDFQRLVIALIHYIARISVVGNNFEQPNAFFIL